MQLTQSFLLLSVFMAAAPALAAPLAIDINAGHPVPHHAPASYHFEGDQRQHRPAAAVNEHHATIYRFQQQARTQTDPALNVNVKGVDLDSPKSILSKRGDPTLIDSLPVVGPIVGGLLSGTASTVVGLPIVGPLVSGLGSTLSGLPAVGPIIKDLGDNLDLGPIFDGEEGGKPHKNVVQVRGSAIHQFLGTPSSGVSASASVNVIQPILGQNGKYYYPASDIVPYLAAINLKAQAAAVDAVPDVSLPVDPSAVTSAVASSIPSPAVAAVHRADAVPADDAPTESSSAETPVATPAANQADLILPPPDLPLLSSDLPLPTAVNQAIAADLVDDVAAAVSSAFESAISVAANQANAAVPDPTEAQSSVDAALPSDAAAATPTVNIALAQGGSDPSEWVDVDATPAPAEPYAFQVSNVDSIPLPTDFISASAPEAAPTDLTQLKKRSLDAVAQAKLRVKLAGGYRLPVVEAKRVRSRKPSVLRRWV